MNFAFLIQRLQMLCLKVLLLFSDNQIKNVADLACITFFDWNRENKEKHKMCNSMIECQKQICMKYRICLRQKDNTIIIYKTINLTNKVYNCISKLIFALVCKQTKFFFFFRYWSFSHILLNLHNSIMSKAFIQVVFNI